MSIVHDKFKAQELHLNRLQNVKTNIKKMKYGGDGGHTLAPDTFHSDVRGVQMMAI